MCAEHEQEPDVIFFREAPPPWGPPFARRRRGWGRHLRGGGPRARRGDVRAGILALLAEEPMHGYQIIQELESRSGGLWRPSPGSVYPTLQLLEDEGLVSREEAEGKRVYALTDEGRARASEQRERTGRLPWEEVSAGADHPAIKLREAAFQVGAAAMQVAHAGSGQQAEQALEILTETRRRIYALLAEDAQQEA
ncbi:MAG: PadR family transcriptional regulator [Candidatus Rokuibacteriota bacterium]|nr:MAG: PadR family transcriptional regulator [Candidatus Rokubacteria bacterium]